MRWTIGWRFQFYLVKYLHFEWNIFAFRKLFQKTPCDHWHDATYKPTCIEGNITHNTVHSDKCIAYITIDKCCWLVVMYFMNKLTCLAYHQMSTAFSSHKRLYPTHSAPHLQPNKTMYYFTLYTYRYEDNTYGGIYEWMGILGNIGILQLFPIKRTYITQSRNMKHGC